MLLGALRKPPGPLYPERECDGDADLAAIRARVGGFAFIHEAKVRQKLQGMVRHHRTAVIHLMHGRDDKAGLFMDDQFVELLDAGSNSF